MPDQYTLMTKESHPEIMGHVERMCMSAGLAEIPPIRIVQDDVVGAWIHDLNGEKIGGIGFLAITSGALNVLLDREAAAILAHEIAHDWLPNNQVISNWNLIKFACAGTAHILLQLTSSAVKHAASQAENPEKYNRRRFCATMAKLVTGAAVPYTGYKAYFNQEAREAHSRVDTAGAELFGDIDAMISGLQKIRDHSPAFIDTGELDKRIEALEIVKQEWENNRETRPTGRAK